MKTLFVIAGLTFALSAVAQESPILQRWLRLQCGGCTSWELMEERNYSIDFQVGREHYAGYVNKITPTSIEIVRPGARRGNQYLPITIKKGTSEAHNSFIADDVCTAAFGDHYQGRIEVDDDGRRISLLSCSYVQPVRTLREKAQAVAEGLLLIPARGVDWLIWAHTPERAKKLDCPDDHKHTRK